MNKKIHFVGIGGIGISAIARWYHRRGYDVSGSDRAHSTVTEALAQEGIQIHIGETSDNVPKNAQKVVYSEAVATRPDVPIHEQVRDNLELAHALDSGIPLQSYPEALGEIIASGAKSICVAGTHGKSTTTSMIGRAIQQTNQPATVVTGTLLKEFNNTNLYDTGTDIVVAESCEYKRAFHNYYPTIGVILNIEHDHHDCYPTWEEYLESFIQFAYQCEEIVVIEGEKGIDELLMGIRHQASGFKKMNGGRLKKIHSINKEQRTINTYLLDGSRDARSALACVSTVLPHIISSIPGDHIYKDALCAYVSSTLVGIAPHAAQKAIESYQGAWRRMELVGTTQYSQKVYSDYGHTPTEIQPTLASLREMYPNKKIICVFQPHQYARTIALLDDFMTCFGDADQLIIPNIYFSRDSQRDVETMPAKKFVECLQGHHSHVMYGNGLENTRDLLQKITDENAVIMIQGAGDVDELRDVVTSY